MLRYSNHKCCSVPTFALYDSQGTHLDTDLVYKAFNLRQIKKCKLHKDKWVHLMVGSHQHVESAGVDAGALQSSTGQLQRYISAWLAVSQVRLRMLEIFKPPLR